MGRRLWRSLFTIDAVRVAQQFLDAGDGPKLLTVDSADPRVLHLPWELAADEDSHLFAARPPVVVRRRLHKAKQARPVQFDLPLRVLMVIGRPDGVGFIDPRSSAVARSSVCWPVCASATRPRRGAKARSAKGREALDHEGAKGREGAGSRSAKGREALDHEGAKGREGAKREGARSAGSRRREGARRREARRTRSAGSRSDGSLDHEAAKRKGHEGPFAFFALRAFAPLRAFVIQRFAPS